MPRLRLARVEPLPALDVPGNAIDPRPNASGTAVAWRDADSRVLVRRADGTLRVFRGHAFTWADDASLFVGDNKLRAVRKLSLDSDAGEHVAAAPSDVQFIAAAPDGRIAFVCRAMIYLTGNAVPMLEGAAQHHAIPFFSADGQMAALMINEHASELIVRGDCVASRTGATPPVQPAFSPDGERIAAFLSDHELTIVDVESRRRVGLWVHDVRHGSLRWTGERTIEARSGAKAWRLHLEEVEETMGESKYTVAARHAAGIEAEMRRIGLWQETPLLPDQLNFTQAFGMDKLAFSQWLQFIFLDRVRGICAAEGAFPPSSQVSAQAVREFDGLWEAERLQSLLSEFDDWINRGTPV